MSHFTRPGHKGLLFLFAALALWFVAALPARAANNVPYLDSAGKPQTAATATDITAADCGTTLASGWYVVSSNVTCAATITISGDVNLILEDGYTLDVTGSANAGIEVNSGNSLTLYGQSAGSGTLTATGDVGGAGIGGGYIGSGGTITINGGTVTANGGGTGAGIGGGYGGNGGTITINGGTVTATGDVCGAGIGGGALGEGGNIAIGGHADVTATGGRAIGLIGGGAGIGSGGTVTPTPMAAGAISISTSGSVNATGGGADPLSTGGSGSAVGEGGYNGGDGGNAVFLDINATAGAGGAITPATAQSTVGGRVMFTITPDPGYVLDTLTLDGADVKASVGAGGVLVVTGTAANQALAAGFKLGASATASVPALDPKALLMLVLLLVGVGGAAVAKVTTRRAR